MILVGLALGGLSPSATAADATGDPGAGARAFRTCVACHSLAAGRHMTGPSLAGIWGRKAGTVEGFTRYSPALKSSDIIWNEETLDSWLASPRALIPGNYMTMRGIRDAKAREDLIAFFREAASGNPAHQDARTGVELRDLKKLGPDHQVTAIRYCGDTYRVTTKAGELAPYWEFNLRFKTDSGDKGPAKGQPAIMPAGMRGDRASVIFADPSEISAFVQKKC